MANYVIVFGVVFLFLISSAAYVLKPETVYDILRQDADGMETEIDTLKQEFNVIKRRVKDSKEQNRILQKKVEDDLKVLIQKPKEFDNKLIKKLVGLERFLKRKFSQQRKQMKTLETRVRKMEAHIPETGDTSTLSRDHGNNDGSTTALPRHTGGSSFDQDLPGHHRGNSSFAQHQAGHHGHKGNSTHEHTRPRPSKWRKVLADFVGMFSDP